MMPSRWNIHRLLIVLLVTASLQAQPRRLDHVASERWEADPSDGVAMTISTEENADRALRIDFDFGGGGGYAIARLPLDIELPENYEFSFLLRGETPVNTLEFKLLDPSGENVWWRVRRRYRFPEEWTRVRFKKRHLDFAWGPKGGGEIEHLSAIEIVVTAAEGGSGTIWVDDLTFTPLEPERPYDLTPSVSASSEAPSQPAPHALDGDPSTAWHSAGQRTQSLQIDFLRRRELGGLVIDWAERGAAVDYDVLLSIDGETWDRLWRVRDGDGGRDYVVVPEAEARFVRLELLRGDGERYGIREIEVAEPQFSETKNAMFERIAAEARPGLYPKYLSRTQSYWTIVGAPEDPGEALINEEGMIDIDPIRFSLDPFISVDDDGTTNLLTWADASEITQSLENDELPIPTVVRDHGDVRLSITAFARGEAGHSVLWVRYGVENLSAVQRDVTLHLAIRPLQVNPSWQFLAIEGGSAEILSIEQTESGIVVNDTTTIIPLTSPDSFGAQRFDQGDVVEALAEGRLPSPGSVEDPFGSASGVMSWSLFLSPGERREVVVTVPFHERPADLDGGLASSGASQLAERELAVARSEWANRLGRVRIHLPESASHISRAIRSNLAYILINMDGPSIQPGSRSYDRSWIRDGSLTSAALLRLAHSEEVRRFIEWYAKYQREGGYVPCCVGTRGADPVPENDSHGQFIYLVKEYFDFTGDRMLLEQMWPHVRKAVDYIDTLRHERMTDEYRQPETLAFYGLVPESISHEGYSAKPMHSYWDDFFTLKGLVDATEIASVIGADQEHARFARIRDEFRRDLFASIERTMVMHGIDYIPGSVELGDF
ncbi:MAG TPA: discoidin domain-containing protein, partial [Thermoanaerobaculia bacterium]|nr:discoidin domain-containing protein [Thermoanaerobaculia bacterium]